MARSGRPRGHIEPHRGKFRAIVSGGTDLLSGMRRVLKEACDTRKPAEDLADPGEGVA
jgi:hypothetical protein